MEWGNLTADADAIRQHFGIDRWAVIGHSFGGMVALEYAIRYPQNLTHLVLLNTGGDSVWVQSNASSELEKKGYSKLVVETATRFYRGAIARNEFMKSMMILGKAYYSHPSVWLLLKEAFHGLRIHANAGACVHGFKELFSGWTVMDKLNQIQAPTLIVAGSDDFQFPPVYQKELQIGILGSRLELIADAGHNAHIEQAGKIVALIGSFLEDG